MTQLPIHRKYALAASFQRGIAIILGTALPLVCSGCDSFVEVEIPSAQLAAPQVFEEAGTAEAAMSDVYSKMRDAGILSGSPTGFGYALGLYADELGDAPAATLQELLEAVLRERRVELFCEFGHRFFDLKRFGAADSVLGGIKPGWDNHDSLFPIPQSELQLNQNLNPQNSGY